MQKYLTLFKSSRNLLEKSLFSLIALLFVFIPLYPKFPLFRFQETFVAIRIEDFIIAVTLTVWLFYIFISGKIRLLLKDNLNLCLILFFFIGLVSLFSAIFVTQTIQAKLGLLHYLRRVELMLLLPVVASVITTKRQLKFLLILLSTVTIVVCLYALGQQYLRFPVISTTNSEFSKGQILYLTPGARVNSTFAGHYDLAVFLVMALVLLSALTFAFKNILAKLFCVALSGLSAVVLILTAARVSFVAVVIGVIFSLLLTGKKIFVGLIIVLAILVLVYPSPLRDRFISTITVNLDQGGVRYTATSDRQEARSRLNIPTIPGEPWDKTHEPTQSASISGKIASDIAPGEPIKQTDLEVYRSFGIRFNVEWPAAIRAFLKNPLLGTGYSSLGLATDNDLLRSLGEVGILGTIAFALILMQLTKKLFGSIKYAIREKIKFLKYFSVGVLALVLAFLINGLFIDVFEASKIASLFWMIAGLSIAVDKIYRSND